MKKPKLYPLQFTPILKEKIWGGKKLKQLFNKKSEDIIGESWELSGIENSESIVSNGTLVGKNIVKLIELYKEQLVGKKVYECFGTNFPLLFKFIDATKDLSVQLHPNDTLALKRHNSFGKTEMWYIMQAKDDARLILGFNRKISQKIYQKYISSNNLLQILNSEKVKQGDVFFIEPGTVHAIGAGVVLAEIQQTSDITYRIYDWDRPDSTGFMRDLHTDQAVEAINYKPNNARIAYTEKQNEVVLLKQSDFFEINKLSLSKSITRDYRTIDSFVVYMCVEGMGTIITEKNSKTIHLGETILIPAFFKNVTIKTEKGTFLEIYIP